MGEVLVNTILNMKKFTPPLLKDTHIFSSLDLFYLYFLNVLEVKYLKIFLKK